MAHRGCVRIPRRTAPSETAGTPAELAPRELALHEEAQDEHEALTQESNRYAAQWRQQSGWLRNEARRWLPLERQAALDATEANIDALGAELRRLNLEQGSLQLR